MLFHNIDSEREIRYYCGMHPPILFTLSLFSLALSSLGSPADTLDIQKTLSDYAFVLNSGSFSGAFSPLSSVFTDKITFDFGGQIGIIRGLPKLEVIFKKNFPHGTVMQHAQTTQSISVLSASSAKASSYFTATYFGQNHLSGQTLAFYGVFLDTLVKTSLRGNGGWRIINRNLTLFVRPLFSHLSDVSN